MSDAVRAVEGFRRQEDSGHLGIWEEGCCTCWRKPIGPMESDRHGCELQASPVTAQRLHQPRSCTEPCFPSCERGREGGASLAAGFPTCSTGNLWTDEPLSWGAPWAL